MNHEELQKLEEQYKLVDQVLKDPPGRKRWRSAVNLWLHLNNVEVPETGERARDFNKRLIAELKDIRKAQKNEFGTSGGGMRSYLALPQGAHLMILRVDPNAFKSEQNATQMFKEFPEYRAAERY